MPDLRQSHRSFTVRLPMARYLLITEMARKDKANINATVNKLLELGMGEQVNLDEALASLVRRIVAEDKENKDD